jgi:hypothetical protein
MTRFVAIGWAVLGAVVASVVLLGFVLPRAELKSASPEAQAETERAVDGTVHLEPDQQSRAGVTIALPRSGTAPVLQPAYARALDVAPLAVIDSEIAAASAAAGASRAEAIRLAGLAAEDQSASVRSVEAARAQAMADQAHVDLASRRSVWSSDRASPAWALDRGVPWWPTSRPVERRWCGSTVQAARWPVGSASSTARSARSSPSSVLRLCRMHGCKARVSWRSCEGRWRPAPRRDAF